MKKLTKNCLLNVCGGGVSTTNLATNSPSIGFAGLGGDVKLCIYGPTGLTAKKVINFSSGASNALSNVVANSPPLPPNPNPVDGSGCPVYDTVP